MECQIHILQSDQDFQDKVINSEFKSVILVFTAEWCPPSQNLIISLKKELESQRRRLATHGEKSDQLHVPIYVVDVDKEEVKEVVKQFNPTTLPYVYLFEEGKYIAQFSGMDQFAIQKIALKAFEKLA